MWGRENLFRKGYSLSPQDSYSFAITSISFFMGFGKGMKHLFAVPLILSGDEVFPAGNTRVFPRDIVLPVQKRLRYIYTMDLLGISLDFKCFADYFSSSVIECF